MALGSVLFIKTLVIKKLHLQQIESHVTISKVTYRLCIFYSTSSFVSNFVCFREIIAGFDIDESYNYIQHVI